MTTKLTTLFSRVLVAFISTRSELRVSDMTEAMSADKVPRSRQRPPPDILIFAVSGTS